MTGYTFSVKRMQTHDGPGLRTTVFMKGCSLRCAWCHNPESLSADQEIWRDDSKCIGCGFCCHEDGVRADHSNWSGDLSVVENCPSKALEALRQEWPVEELLPAIDRDAGFFEEGGVTFSGGEPALQWPFVSAVMKRCKENGLHTALDTCGAAPAAAFDALLPQTSLVLFDLKMMDPEKHRKWTGRDNLQILKNLRRIAAYIQDHPEVKLWIRTPLIPAATATESNLAAVGSFIKEELGGAVERWELCAFNNLCVDKYRRLKRDWQFADTPLLERGFGDQLLEAARENFSPVSLKGRFV